MVERTTQNIIMEKDYSLKKYILENDLDKEFISICRSIYINYVKSYVDSRSSDIDFSLKCLVNFKERYGNDIYRVCCNLNRSRQRKKSRVSERIKFMLNSGRCLFLTFTFTDTSLEKTSRDYRREKVCKWLQLNGGLYIANIDFGVKDEYIDKFGISRVGTHREHYHAILLTDNIVDYTSWKYGALNGIEIYNKSDKAISQYITKFSNHCLKDSTKNERVIYSRSWRVAKNFMNEFKLGDL